MYPVEIYGRVRRAVLVEGRSQRSVAREFGLARVTVRKKVGYSIPPGYRRKEPAKRSHPPPCGCAAGAHRPALIRSLHPSLGLPHSPGQSLPTSLRSLASSAAAAVAAIFAATSRTGSPSTAAAGKTPVSIPRSASLRESPYANIEPSLPPASSPSRTLHRCGRHVHIPLHIAIPRRV